MLSLGMAVVWMALQQTPPPPPPPAKSDLVLTLAVDRAECVVGDTIQAEVILQNNGDKDLDVAALCFEERSVSFDVVFESSPGKQKPFLFSAIRPDPHLVDRLPLPRVNLKPKKAMVSFFGVPTLRPGAMTITARYGDKDLRSASVTLKVAEQADGAGRLAAILDTSEGTIQIDLLPEEAPNNVAHFIGLARRGFYNNMNFHRVVKGNWIQTGCPYDNGFGGPGCALKSEAKDQTLPHDAGMVAMSQNLKSDHTGSQFFVELTRIPSFDKKFTIIGKVSGAGLDVAKKIGAVETDPKTDRPRQDVPLKKVTIVVVK
jgi:cyclophilin family peptidyl-prolyl cis-trans isomerase